MDLKPFTGAVDDSTFCLAPFVSLYLSPSQEVTPCCIFKYDEPLGVARSSAELVATYNNEKTRQLRHDLIHGVKSDLCKNCWKFEEHNSTGSFRDNVNRNNAGDREAVLAAMNPSTYELSDIKLRFLDIRFSNVCNLKCRTCCGDFSSTWAIEEEKLGWARPGAQQVRVAVGDTDMLDFIMAQLPNVREIYFAGGEPLFQEEHYRILDRILEIGLQNDIAIRYNTNFSTLTFKHYDAIAYWKQFKSVNVGASLDGSYERGEYLRKGISWSKVVANRRRLLAEAPHVQFHLSFTLSLMNSYNLVDFHREWVELGFVRPWDLIINILHDPSFYSIKCLPANHKANIEILYRHHIAWLHSISTPEIHGYVLDVIRQFEAALSYLREPAAPGWTEGFKHRNGKVDKIREESFWKVFPELIDLVELVS